MTAPSDTPMTDAYEAEYLAWQDYTKRYGSIPEAMEQCPLEDDPIGMMRKLERALHPILVHLSAIQREGTPHQLVLTQEEIAPLIELNNERRK